MSLTVYQKPGQTVSTQVILELPESTQAITIRVTLVSGNLETTVYEGSYPAEASRHPQITITAQMPGDYAYNVYIDGKFSYQQKIKLE